MEVSDDVDFVDLACILKISPDTVLEKLGSQINASFFDASNIAGTLKQKGLIDFSSQFPGPNGIVVTDKGKAYISEAETKVTAPFDQLDGDILKQLGGGKRTPKELAPSLNLRPKDLALRIYKLSKQGFIIYELKNGTVELMLSENGFLKVKSMPGGGVLPGQPQQLGVDPATMAPNAEETVKKAVKARAMKTNMLMVVVAIVIVIFVALHLLGYI